MVAQHQLNSAMSILSNHSNSNSNSKHRRIPSLLMSLLLLLLLTPSSNAWLQQLPSLTASAWDRAQHSMQQNFAKRSTNTSNGSNSNNNSNNNEPRKVLVTGASGKTGRLVLERLLLDDQYHPKALVRDEASAKQLVKQVAFPLEDIIISDITSPTFAQDLPSCLKCKDAIRRKSSSFSQAFRAATTTSSSSSSSSNNNYNKNGKQPTATPNMNWHAIIICTSAVPKLSRRSLAKAICKVPLNIFRRKSPLLDYRSLRFKWKHQSPPREVDYEGQIAQFKLAERLKMKQVVLVSSMGGTDPDNFLNSVGKEVDGTNGDILMWKRKSEEYLIQKTKLDHVIVHPGGLVDEDGSSNNNNNNNNHKLFALDVDDHLGSEYGRQTQISRPDLADLCVASLAVPSGTKLSFDCITVDSEQHQQSQHSAVLGTTAQTSLHQFLRLSKRAEYRSTINNNNNNNRNKGNTPKATTNNNNSSRRTPAVTAWS